MFIWCRMQWKTFLTGSAYKMDMHIDNPTGNLNLTVRGLKITNRRK